MSIRIDADSLAQVRSFASRGDKVAAVIAAILDGTFFSEMTAGVEAANVIRVSGQIKDQDGTKKTGIRDVVIESFPIAGVGTMTVFTGTAKSGSGTTKLWLQTDANGAFAVDVLNATAEDNLISAITDNGEVEQLKLVFA